MVLKTHYNFFGPLDNKTAAANPKPVKMCCNYYLTPRDLQGTESIEENYPAAVIVSRNLHNFVNLYPTVDPDDF